MKIGGEEVELVTAFEQLRAGMIVWTLPCRWCSGRHRFILANRRVGVALDVDASLIPEHVKYLALPKPPCERGFGRSISARSVARRTVYRVVDPKLTADSLASDARRVKALADIAARARGERVR